jgi:hypothetical protein
MVDENFNIIIRDDLQEGQVNQAIRDKLPSKADFFAVYTKGKEKFSMKLNASIV